MYSLSLKPLVLLLYKKVRDYKQIPSQSEIEQILLKEWGDTISGIVNRFQTTEQIVLQDVYKGVIELITLRDALIQKMVQNN